MLTKNKAIIHTFGENYALSISNKKLFWKLDDVYQKRHNPSRLYHQRINSRLISRNEIKKKSGGENAKNDEQGEGLEASDLIKSGSVLLSHVLRHSTIAAEDFRFPVRDGVERLIPRHGHQTKQDRTILPSFLFY